MKKSVVYFVVSVLYSAFCLLFISCATTPQLPPSPPKHVYKEEPVARVTANSLWRDTASLFEDNKARRLNDLVTIKVEESISGFGKADTNTSRDSSADYGITDFFGMNTDFGIHKLPLLNGFYKGTNVFSPTVKGSGASEFAGKGDTSREGKLLGTITARVVEVMPNGNLALESRKEITINNEKQILILRGMVRPEDIAIDNTVASSKIADAEIYFVGDGIIQEKQNQGWLARFLDKVWPF